MMQISLSATSQEAITLPKELLKKTATEAGELIHKGEVTSVELTQSLLEHAHSLNEQVNAYVSFREVRSKPCRSVSQGVASSHCLPKTAWPPTWNY